MRKLACVISLVVLIGAVALAATSAAAPTGTIRVTATVADVRVAEADTSEIRLLWNRAVSNLPIGNGIQRCSFLGRSGAFGGGLSYCDAVYSLPKGKIAVAGVRRSRRQATYVILGGTRLYAGATGTLYVSSAGQAELALTFLLP